MVRCEFKMMARPEWMNGFGTMHGAEYVKILDELAGVTADAHEPIPFVTGTMHYFRLLVPVYARDVLRAVGTVLYTTRHSVVVETSLYVRRRLTNEEQLAAHGYFTMVSKRKDGDAAPVSAYFHDDPDMRAHAEAVREAIERFGEIEPLS